MTEPPLAPVLIEQVLDRASELIGLDDSARAEVWASGVLGLWREPGAAVDALGADRQLLEALEASGGSEALALALAIGAVGPESTRQRAVATVQRLREGGPAEPSWATAVGTARPGAAMLIVDPDQRGQRTAIFEFLSDDGTHTLLAELSAAEELVDLNFGPPLEDLVAALAEPGADELQPEPAEADTLAEEVAVAWRRAVDSGLEPSESAIMNGCAASTRLALFDSVTEVPEGWSAAVPAPVAPTPLVPQDPASREAPDPASREADEAALGVLESALARLPLPEPAATDIGAAAADALAALEGGEWPAPAIAAETALGAEAQPDAVLAACAGAFVTRRPQLLPNDEAAAVGTLEWADWLGAVIELVRAGPGTAVTPAGLVDNVNRCPEVSSSIPKSDREFVEHAFGLVIEAWTCCGLVAADGSLTEVGCWALPTGLRWAWSDASDGRRY